ncbi:hypothetical protein KVR01_007200 [Diaporthe batatas]|uniref:uncharacterized protein n=1 Tax=Diaporthe batatas TaxID=748121 RepID=UPI001D05A652|nr:uncharacterized protein KVR01_007200 [Diaporthe batatas]KAG8162722.1 hypothetical protein KVR01_007200 [Diaporthe batatas]
MSGGLAASASSLAGINYALEGDHLPIQKHRLEEIARINKNREPRKDEFSKKTVAKTAAARRRALEECADYFKRTAHIDHRQIWYGLCLDDTEAEVHCMNFLEDYVTNAKKRVVLTGEHMDLEEVRSITSAKSVVQFWDTLIGEANSTVLQEKRDQDPKNRTKWVLSNSGRKPTAGYAGAVSRIRKWIQDTLADKLNLTLHQTFEKKEATPDDIMMVINTIWNNPRDIDRDERLRVAFHSTILIGALGGFRPGAIECLKYKDIDVEMMNTSNGRALTAKTKVNQNKLRTGTCSKGQAEFVDFSATFVPEKRICVVSLIVARALADQAFDAGYQSFEEVLNRPNFDGTHWVPLRWKTEMLERPIFPINYNQFVEIWNRAWLVSGARDQVRLYSIRVGTGGRIDEHHSNAIRNYVMSNTDRVYECSYLPRHLKIDLLKTNFAASGTAENSDEIFEMLRRASLKSDPNAPLYPTHEDIEKVKQGQVFRDLQAAYDQVRKIASSNSPGVKRARARVYAHLNRAKKVIVKRRREEYFTQVDRLRASGRSAAELASESQEVIPETKSCSLGASRAIGKFLEQPELGGEKRQHYYVEVICAYLTLRPASVEYLVGALSTEGMGSGDQDGDKTVRDVRPEPFTNGNPTHCLLGCEQSFTRRNSLTRHVMQNHGVTFGLQFECPECLRLGIRPAALIGSVLEWSIHVEMCHGKGFAPTMDAERATQITSHRARNHLPKELARCLICNAHFCTGSGFSRHFHNRHIGKDLSAPLPCPECHRQGNSDIIWVNGVEEWLQHSRVIHAFDSIRGVKMSQDDADPELLHIPKESRVKSSWGKTSRRPITPSEKEKRLERRRIQQRAYKERLRLRQNAAKEPGSQCGSPSDAPQAITHLAERRSRRVVESIQTWDGSDETSQCGDEFAEDSDDPFDAGDMTKASDSDTLFEDGVMPGLGNILSESLSSDDDFLEKSNDIGASHSTSRAQPLAFNDVYDDLYPANILSSDNTFAENTDYGEPMLQTPTRSEGILPPAVGTDLHQAFDEAMFQCGKGDSPSETEPYGAIPWMISTDSGQELPSEQVSGCVADAPKPDTAAVGTLNVSENFSFFTTSHRPKRNVPVYFSLREL